jgi:cation diffusion facilitator CzcD-associated flavoprotein CzcO
MGDIDIDVVVIGGGQAALAVGYYLRRSGLTYVILDDQRESGGSWRRTWPSLCLFSPAQWSSLPGYLMPRTDDEYPTRSDVLAYLAEYERRYALPVERPVRVNTVERLGDRGELRVRADDRAWKARAVVSATGIWANPVLPSLPGQEAFRGRVLHSAFYSGVDEFVGQSVIVVGAGNSGAQIVAELSLVAQVTWATLAPPVFLPDDVDGRYLFEQATARYKAEQEGRTPDPPRSLGDIVAVPSVREARARGALEARPMFEHFTETGVAWHDGSNMHADAVIWATGFLPALVHLAPLGVVDARGRVAVQGTRSTVEPRLWLVGYGNWTGYASATLIGVGRSARATVESIVATLQAS